MTEEEKRKHNIWVKVSEKPLPEKNKQFSGMLKGKPAIVCDYGLIEGYVTANGNLERNENVEWLDESMISDDGFLAVLEENYKACQNLTDEDKERSAQDIINETYEDMIEIFKHGSWRNKK